jgi:hypothetical protein
MGSKPSSTAVAAAKNKAAPTEDKLERVRDALRKRRDLEIEKSELEERLTAVNVSINEMEFDTLPTIFNEVGIDKLGLKPEGNLPGYFANLKPYYHANISGDWEPEKRDAAFDELKRLGAEDLVKTKITVLLGRGDRKIAKKVEVALRKLKVGFDRDLSVPWNTLTAWVKDTFEDLKMEKPSLDKIGATVGEKVSLKQVKQEN